MKQSNLAEIFKALSSEPRLKIFEMIYNYCKNENANKLNQSSGCCCGMENAFTIAYNKMNISKSTVSHHIKELQNSGLISCTRNGQSFVCEVNEDAVKAIKEFL